MSTFLQDLQRSNPAKFADIQIAGNQDRVALRNMIRALSMMRSLNTPQEEQRLAAAQRLLRNRY